MLRAPTLVLLVANFGILAGTLGCDGTQTDEGDDAELSYSDDIQPIFDEHCVSCHAPGGDADGILDLSGDAFTNIAGVAPMGAPATVLIEAGDPDSSYLVAKLRGTQGELGGGGSPMPFGQDPLPPDDLATIVDWVSDGAQP